ncbi:MAG TPA: hypothetical protein VF218_14005 [Acidothermaceae bacterium]
MTTIEEPAAVDEPAKSGPVAPPPAPLGRYVSADRAGAAELHTVRLLNLPISLFLRAREHHDDLIRELTLMAIRRHSGEAPEVSERLAELVEILGRRYGASASRADIVRDAAIERGEASVDLTYEVPSSILPDLARLKELLDAADEFCRTEQLLTLPRTPEMVAFSHWYCDEFLNQINGLAPTPWTGPLQ